MLGLEQPLALLALPLALLPFVVWIVAVSIGMIRRPSAVPVATATAGVATVGA